MLRKITDHYLTPYPDLFSIFRGCSEYLSLIAGLLMSQAQHLLKPSAAALLCSATIGLCLPGHELSR